MITILTHSPELFSKENIKARLKNMVGKRYGPTAVVESLARGLLELDVDVQIDPPVSKISGIVHVVSGIDALRFSIEQKRAGVIRTLIAGPNLTITPDEHEKILLSPEIDMILFPSQWTKDFYVSMFAELETKIHIWPAGVHDPGAYSPRNTGMCLIYQKNAPDEVVRAIESELRRKNIPYRIVRYGHFKREYFYDLLIGSDFMIYLSASESQGIALQEAWIRNVPTFVWTEGVWKYKEYVWRDEKISAPCLTEKTGRFFKADKDLPQMLASFIRDIYSFDPRSYCLANLTDKICAEKYIAIMRQYE